MSISYKILLALLVLWVTHAFTADADVSPSRASFKEHDCMSRAGTYAVVHSMLLRGASDKKALSIVFSEKEQQDDVEGMKRLVDWLRTVPKHSHGALVRAVYKDCMKVDV